MLVHWESMEVQEEAVWKRISVKYGMGMEMEYWNLEFDAFFEGTEFIKQRNKVSWTFFLKQHTQVPSLSNFNSFLYDSLQYLFSSLIAITGQIQIPFFIYIFHSIPLANSLYPFSKFTQSSLLLYVV